MTDRQFVPTATKEDVLKLLQEQPGEKYTCVELSQHFGVPVSTMRVILVKLEATIRCTDGGKPRQFWYPTADSMAAVAARRTLPEWTQLVGYGQQMRDAMNRRGF